MFAENCNKLRKASCALLAAVLLATAASATGLMTGCGREEDAPVTAYRAETLKLPDGIVVFQVRLMDDGAVFFDAETTAVIFADYKGVIQSKVELNLPDTEQVYSLDINEENGCTYVQTSEALYTIDKDGNLTHETNDETPEYVIGISDEERELLREAIDLGVYYENESEVVDVRFMPSGDIICAFRDASFIIRDIIRFVPIDPDQPQAPVEETTLTVYALGFDDWTTSWLSAYVSGFNRSNAAYAIEMKFFLNDSIDHDAALRSLNTALTAGDIPDIIVYDNMMSVKKHADSGLLADLYEIMAGDPDFDKDDYLPNAFTASELDGKLYTVFSQFGIHAIAAQTAGAGDGMSWTLDEFAEYINQSDDIFHIAEYFSDESSKFLSASQEYFTVDMSYKLFIDPVTGELDFDRSVFMKLLEIAKRFPAETVESPYSILDGTGPDGPLMQLDMAGHFSNAKFTKMFFGGEFIYKGYPGVSGNGAFFDPPARFAITALSENKDGAWAFLKYMLDNKPATNYQYPVRLDILEKEIIEAATDDYIGISGPEGSSTIVVDLLVDEEIAAITKLIESIDHVIVHDRTIAAIIETEVRAYFAGQCTAEQAADVIESKIAIYLSESS